MKQALATLAVVTASLVPYTANAQQAVALQRSTIVILVDSPIEMKRHSSDEGYNEATGDFSVYAERMTTALKDQKSLKIRWSSAPKITFPGTRFPPVVRKRIGGWGYVFYRHGRQPVIIEGVAIDDQLICTASRLFDLVIDGYECDTSHTVLPTLLENAQRSDSDH